MAPKEGAYIKGRVIADRYQIQEVLGGGEITDVLKVKDLVGNRVLALKIAREPSTKEIELKLNQEYFLLSRFNHPYIITPFDFGLANNKQPYFTMEYFDGIPINKMFKGYSTELLHVLIQVLHALDAIHNQGLIHCDLKPQNILVHLKQTKNSSQNSNQEPRVKLLDFGFADTSTSFAQTPRGTLGYIAPEVYKGIGADGRADLYSLGMVIYEIITGKGPSSEKDLRSWLRNQYYSNFDSPRDIDPNIPEQLSNVVMRLIQRDAFRRPVSALEVIEALNSWAKIPQSVLFGASRSEEGNPFLSASSFIGREVQLTGLKKRLESVHAGKGQLIFLTGERGVGKSRLLQEFKFIAKLEGSTILQFAQASLGARPPSLIENLIALLSIYDSEANSSASEPHLREAKNNKQEKSKLGKHRKSNNSEISEHSSLDQQNGEDSKYRIFESVVNRLKELVKSSKVEHSLVLLIDNFELFDPTSIEFLRFLGFSIENERIFIISSSLNEQRVIDLAKEFGSKEYFEHISLEPLTDSETEQLVKAILGNFNKAPELAAWLYTNTGGNPLFIIEALYSLLDSKIIRLEHGRINFDINKLKSFRTSDTVTDIIKLRLHNLAKEELELLRIGATSGGPFSLEFLSAVLGYDERLLFKIIARMQATGLIRPYSKSASSDINYGNIFFMLSSKTLEAIVTDGISVNERRENHRKIALALELLYPHQQEQFLFDLAHHYNQAGMRDRAFTYCQQAGIKARELNLTEQALGFYENALSLSTNLVTSDVRIELIEIVGELRELIGRFNDAIDIYTQGLGIIFANKEISPPKADYLPRMLRRLGLVCQKQGKSEEAISYFEQSLATLKEKNTIEVLNLWNDIGWSFAALGDYKKAEKFLHEALQGLDKLRPEKTTKQFRKEVLLARTLYSLAVLDWYRGDTNMARELAVRSLELYESIKEQSYISKVSQFLATLYWEKGDLNKAKNSYTRILPLQREKGDIYFRIRTLQGLGLVSFDIGEWHQALEYLEEAKGLCEKIGDQSGLADTLGNLGLVLEEIGEWSKAIEYYKKDIELRQNSKDDKGLAIAYVNAANLLVKKGELLDAETFLKESLSFSQRLKDKQILSEYNFVMAKLNSIREKYPEAVKDLAVSLRLKRRTKEKRNIIERLLLSAEIKAGLMDWKKCLANCEQTQRLLTKWMNPKMSAIVSRWHGLAKSGLGFLDQGKEDLKKSIELLRSLGSKYELALSLQVKCRALCQIAPPELDSSPDGKTPVNYKPLTERELTEVSDDLREASEIFSSLGAKIDEERVKDMISNLSQIQSTRHLKGRERGEYLKVFYELSELINMNLEKEDFADRLLDLIIDVTQAERGLLFLMQADRLYPAAARNVDHTTLEDAQTISKTAIRQVKKRAEPIICADALSDSRFVSTNSVILNKIRSLVCVPLKVEDKVIGTIYLDSRINPNVFVDDDKNLLISVANLLAATIDRSFAFKKMQDDFSVLREDILTDAVTGYFLGRSKAIKDVYQIVEQIAPTDCNVLLLGETGSGKGVLARLVHANSNRRANKLVSINCGTLPETLFESELFGHAKGSFTGAIRDKEGLFEIAENGTIFMDEITNTSLSIQAKLLEVLEDKIIRRVGETEARRVDVRLICATNRELEKEVKEGRFREDLYYRLNVVTIHVPPLRERTSDIMLLAGYFLKRYAKQLNKPILGFEDNISQVLVQYPWPGNVRELQNVIERAVIMSQKRKISIDNLGPKFESIAKTIKTEKGEKKSLEKEEVVEALKATQGNVSRAAQILLTHRRQLQRLLKRYGIDKEDFQKQV
jgi:Nif-specific regulatory protein